MHEETILTWNFTNWATVLLMAAVGFIALRFGATLLGRARSGG